MKYFLRSFSLPMIQEGQLSVSGERMCTILVNRLEDYACPVKVLEMRQDDTDALAQVHPHPHAGILQKKNKLKQCDP